MKKFFSVLFFVFAFLKIAYGIAEVRNVFVVGGCYTPGQNITVNFEVRCSAWQTTFGNILFSTNSTSEYTDDAVWTSAGQQDPPDNNGHDGGSMQSQGSNGNTWYQKSYVVKVPSWYNGTQYIIVNVAENYLQLWGWGKHIENSASTTMIKCVPPTATNTPIPPTATNTPVPTFTQTPITGEGSAVVFPAQVVAGSTGNTFRIEYTAGSTAWATYPNYGTLEIIIPDGWSSAFAPDRFPYETYVTADAKGGTILAVMAYDHKIIIKAHGLPAESGKILVIYGNMTFGNPGVTVQNNTGVAKFVVKTDTNGENTIEIKNNPVVNVQ